MQIEIILLLVCNSAKYALDYYVGIFRNAIRINFLLLANKIIYAVDTKNYESWFKINDCHHLDKT